jgi:nitrile hydratase accessory protein
MTTREKMDNSELIARLTEEVDAPLDENQEIIFNNPWEAKAFALVVQMHQENHYEWAEWAAQLSAEIKSVGEEQSGEDYYLLWLKAAESLVVKKGLCKQDELLNRKNSLRAAQDAAS